MNTDSQYVEIDYEIGDVNQNIPYSFQVNVQRPVRAIEFQLGCTVVGDPTGCKILTSDLNPDFPNIIGAIGNTKYVESIGTSSMKIIYEKPISVQGSHWVKFYDVDVNNKLSDPYDAFDGRLFLNLTFYME